MLSAQELRFSYTEKVSFSYPDIRSDKESPLLIAGSSGSGKTTLLHVLGGILKPQSGSVVIDGVSIYNLTSRELDRFRGLHTSIIYQKPHFMAALNVLDNILLPQFFSNKKIDAPKAEEIAERLGISHTLQKLPSQLSLGEQQRASIARSLINFPKVLLADEPTSSLDDENCEQVIKLLFEQSAMAGAALVVVTHDARLKKYFTNITSLT